MGVLLTAAKWLESTAWAGRTAAAVAGVCTAAAGLYYLASRADSADRGVRTGQQRRRAMAGCTPDVPGGVTHESSYVCNSRGQLLYTQRVKPVGEPRCLICYCHGFGENASWTSVNIAMRLSKELSAAVALIDYEGHGRSDGVSALVPSFEDLVTDVSKYFDSVRAQYPDLPVFMYGNSMGGAVALKVAERRVAVYNGVVLVAPMCKIADEFKPAKPVLNFVVWLSHKFPTWAITPAPDVLEKSFRDKSQLEYCLQNPVQFKSKPRLATARECLATSLYLEDHLHEVSVPFIVLHGGKDVVTSPAISELLHQRACSPDKTIKLYPEMWHALMYGEPDEARERVFRDVVEWVAARLGPRA